MGKAIKEEVNDAKHLVIDRAFCVKFLARSEVPVASIQWLLQFLVDVTLQLKHICVVWAQKGFSSCRLTWMVLDPKSFLAGIWQAGKPVHHPDSAQLSISKLFAEQHEHVATCI